MNRYAYVGNNPANHVDPYGLFGWSDIKDAAGNAVKAGVKVGVDVYRAGDDVIGAVAKETTVELVASAMQTVSGTMMWMACGAQSASNPIAGGICLTATGWYAAATGVKYLLADGACERKVVLVTAALGLAPPLKYVGNVIAGASSGFEALYCHTTAHASAAYAGPVTAGAKE